jgi:prepilin-type N-terminal cleavage/methylation domain-containing protein
MSRRGNAGYTLAELLVVLALLGIMALVMSDGMRFGGRIWEASARKAEAIDTLAGGQAMLRTVLSRIVPRDFDPAVPADPGLFRASPTRMTFLALAPTSMDAGGISRFEIDVRQDNGSTQLVMSWTPVAGSRGTQRRVAVAGARAITFAFARRDQTGTLAWRNDWQDQNGAPDLILIRVQGQGSPSVVWPDLLVRPRLSRDPACIYDPVSFGCRHA